MQRAKDLALQLTEPFVKGPVGIDVVPANAALRVVLLDRVGSFERERRDFVDGWVEALKYTCEIPRSAVFELEGEAQHRSIALGCLAFEQGDVGGPYKGASCLGSRGSCAAVRGRRTKGACDGPR